MRPIPNLTRVMLDDDQRPIEVAEHPFWTSARGGWNWCVPVPTWTDRTEYLDELFSKAAADGTPRVALFATDKSIAFEMARGWQQACGRQ